MSKIGCDIVRDLLPLYVDHACSEESRELVDEHLDECKPCQEELLRFSNHQVEDQVQEDSGQEFKKFSAGYKKKRKRVRIAIIALSCVAALSLALFGGLYWHGRQETERLQLHFSGDFDKIAYSSTESPPSMSSVFNILKTGTYELSIDAKVNPAEMSEKIIVTIYAEGSSGSSVFESRLLNESKTITLEEGTYVILVSLETEDLKKDLTVYYDIRLLTLDTEK